jgi:hypothetical protein
VWLESVTDTDWVNYPISADQFGRIIYADDSFTEGPRVTDASIVGTGGAPASYWNLDVPAPSQGFSATLQGAADDEDEVPETRYYVCTFVNSYGAEGPPSPPSNQVEWRSGQTVLLEGLPAVPVGNYNITWRRIYRVNTGSTTNTEYQFVTEIAVTSNWIDINDITQANPVVVTTDAAHGFTTGQEVEFQGLGLDVAKDISNIAKSDPARVTTSVPHGYQSGITVEITVTDGMTEIDGTRAEITVIDISRFDLIGVDSTSFSNYQISSNDVVKRVYGMDELDGNSYFISVGNDTEFSLTGIDGSAYKAYVEEGQVQQITSTSYNDGVPSESLGEVLPTELYDAPNDDTIGLVEHPSGFLAGFFGKTLCFSEIGAPHAWPIDYRLATNHYPSSDGLILISGNGAQNITSGIYTRDQWQALSPSTLLAFNWEQWYLGFYDDGSVQRALLIDPFGPELGVQYIDKYATGGYKDIEEDLLYLIINDEIEIWDQGSKLEFTWKSKPVYTPHAVNMAAAKVIADDYPITVKFYVDDVKRYTRIVDSEFAFRLPGGP